MSGTTPVVKGRFRKSAKRAVSGTILEPPARLLWHTVTHKARAQREADYRRGQRYDELTVAVMTRVLKPSSNCVDAGAHTGTILAHMVRLAPNGRHHAFEPLPDCARLLRERYPNVLVHQCALADETAIEPFHYIRSSPAYSGLDKRPWGDFDEESVEMIDVSVARLDDVIDPDVPIDFLKIDVEGAEGRLIRGALRTLRTWKPVVIFEVGPDPMDAYFELGRAGLGVYLLDGEIDSRPPLTEAEYRAALAHDWYYLAHA
jgi:FkbM family methyltransferase